MLINLDNLKSTDPDLHRIVIAELGSVDGIRRIDPDEFPAAIQRELHAWASGNVPRSREWRGLTVNFDALKRSDPDLYKIVVGQMGLSPVGEYELQPIEFMGLAPTTRRRLSDWKTQPPAPEKPQIDMNQVLKDEQAAIQKATDEARGTARLQWWADEGGMEQTPANANLVTEFLQKQLRGYLSEEGVNAAVANLGKRGTNQLTWRQPKAEAPPPSEQPAEVLADWQLPLTATEQQMKDASVAALKDLISRRRVASNQQYIRKGFGSRF